jgi:membrane-associated HD superfamily phosphohydrolase
MTAATSAAPQARTLPNRRELIRLLVAFGGLVLAMTLILGLDLTPGLALKAGEVAPSDVVAPRALNFTNDLLTAQARQAARDNVDPQYDYTTEGAIAVAAEQLSAFTRRVAPLDAAFASGTSAEERAGLLDGVLPGLSDAARSTLQNLEPRRWTAVRAEAARVLDITERNELRDSDVATARLRL